MQMIGPRIKKYRLQKKMSLSELAQRADIAKSYLSSIERNLQKNPSIQFLEKIAAVLGIPVNDLIDADTDADVNTVYKELDPEWMELVYEAMNSGVSKEEFRSFMDSIQSKQNQK